MLTLTDNYAKPESQPLCKVKGVEFVKEDPTRDNSEKDETALQERDDEKRVEHLECIVEAFKPHHGRP